MGNGFSSMICRCGHEDSDHSMYQGVCNTLCGCEEFEEAVLNARGDASHLADDGWEEFLRAIVLECAYHSNNNHRLPGPRLSPLLDRADFASRVLDPNFRASVLALMQIDYPSWGEFVESTYSEAEKAKHKRWWSELVRSAQQKNR